MKRFVISAVVLGVVVLLGSASPDMAASRWDRTSSAKYGVAPTPVPYGTVYTGTGTGFKAGAWTVVAQERHCEGMTATFRETIWAGMTDSSGSFVFNRLTENCKGTYIQTASQGRHGPSVKISFEVN